VREHAKEVRIYCNDIREPFELYTYYVNSHGVAIRHGEFFTIKQQKNGYVSVFCQHFTHGLVTGKSQVYSFTPTNSLVMINIDRTTNTSVVGFSTPIREAKGVQGNSVMEKPEEIEVKNKK